MQIICTSLETDNHANTSPLSFYRPDALPATQLTASKHYGYSCTLTVTGTLSGRLKDYVRKMDPATNVGLNADSIDYYTVGEVCRRKGMYLNV